MNASGLKCLACISAIIISTVVVIAVATSQLGPVVGEVMGIITAGVIALAIFYRICSIGCRKNLSNEQQQHQSEGGGQGARQHRKAAAGKVHPQAT